MKKIKQINKIFYSFHKINFEFKHNQLRLYSSNKNNLKISYLVIGYCAQFNNQFYLCDFNFKIISFNKKKDCLKNIIKTLRLSNKTI